MESRPPQWWAPPPGPLTAPWLLGLLLSPWTVQLAGTVFLLTRSLAPHIREAFIHPPRRVQLIPVSGDLLVAFEHCRLHRGSLWGPGDV